MIKDRRMRLTTRSRALPTQKNVLTLSLSLNVLLAAVLLVWMGSTMPSPTTTHTEQTWHGGHPASAKTGSCWCNNDDYCMCTPNVAIDLVVRSGQHHVWLARRKDTGQYAAFGGFVQVGESVEEAVEREFQEETGIRLRQRKRIKLLGAYSDPRRDNRRHTLSVAYVIHLDDASEHPIAADDVKDVERVRLSDVEKLDLFADHKTMILDSIRKATTNNSPDFVSSPGDFAPDIQRSVC